MCPTPAPLILQIPYVYKYFDLSDTILGVSDRDSFCIPYTEQLKFFDFKVHKKIYYDRYYDIQSKILIIIV